jgi:hypothetical protein
MIIIIVEEGRKREWESFGAGKEGFGPGGFPHILIIERASSSSKRVRKEPRIYATHIHLSQHV